MVGLLLEEAAAISSQYQGTGVILTRKNEIDLQSVWHPIS
jgi:hypothetical protein